MASESSASSSTQEQAPKTDLLQRLINALYENQKEVVENLIYDEDASLSEQDADGRTPIDIVMERIFSELDQEIHKPTPNINELFIKHLEKAHWIVAFAYDWVIDLEVIYKFYHIYIIKCEERLKNLNISNPDKDITYLCITITYLYAANSHKNRNRHLHLNNALMYWNMIQDKSNDFIQKTLFNVIKKSRFYNFVIEQIIPMLESLPDSMGKFFALHRCHNLLLVHNSDSNIEKLRSAIANFKRYLSCKEKRSAEDFITLAKLQQKLGACYSANTDLEKARELYDDAIAALESTIPENEQDEIAITAEKISIYLFSIDEGNLSSTAYFETAKTLLLRADPKTHQAIVFNVSDNFCRKDYKSLPNIFRIIPLFEMLSDTLETRDMLLKLYDVLFIELKRQPPEALLTLETKLTAIIEAGLSTNSDFDLTTTITTTNSQNNEFLAKHFARLARVCFNWAQIYQYQHKAEEYYQAAIKAMERSLACGANNTPEYQSVISIYLTSLADYYAHHARNTSNAEIYQKAFNFYAEAIRINARCLERSSSLYTGTSERNYANTLIAYANSVIDPTIKKTHLFRAANLLLSYFQDFRVRADVMLTAYHESITQLAREIGLVPASFETQLTDIAQILFQTIPAGHRITSPINLPFHTYAMNILYGGLMQSSLNNPIPFFCYNLARALLGSYSFDSFPNKVLQAELTSDEPSRERLKRLAEMKPSIPTLGAMSESGASFPVAVANAYTSLLAENQKFKNEIADLKIQVERLMQMQTSSSSATTTSTQEDAPAVGSTRSHSSVDTAETAAKHDAKRGRQMDLYSMWGRPPAKPPGSDSQAPTDTPAPQGRGR